MKQKRVPLRMCVGCGEMKPKKELVRIVKAPDATDENGAQIPGAISLDTTGRKPGRGAYICHNLSCLQAAAKARRLERAFSCRIDPAVYEALEEEMSRT